MITSSNIPISHTKVVVPRRREEILTRHRLMDMLFEILDKKLLLVSAPAGYGKTSLLIDLRYHSDLPFCWLSLDALDQNPQRFAAYFIGAMAEQFPEFGNQAKAVLNTLTSMSEGLESLVVTLVNEIYKHIPRHFVLVLDDYHLINDVPVIQTFISRFIQLVDENCHLVISSRALTQLPDLPLMVARDLVGGLDLSELAFRAEEIQALFAQNYNAHISDESAQELVDETEGWITGLQLSGLGIAQGMADRLRVARAAGVNLFDYLGQQVLDQQPEDIHFFLLRSSLVEEFDADLCEAVFSELYPERKEWAQWINIVIQKNLFALPVDTERGWIRYHHLFRDFLQDRLKKDHPEEIPPILRKLAKAYETLNEWEKAYFVQKRLGDIDELAGLIERAAPHLMTRAFITLDTWVSQLPPSILSTRPGILSVRGALLQGKGDSREGLELLNRAMANLNEKDGITSLTSTLVRRANVHRHLGDYASAISDADEVLRLTESSDQLQHIQAHALRQKGLCLFRQGQSRQAAKILEHALEIYRRIHDSSHIPILMMETGMVYDAIGKKEITKHFYDEALKVWRKEGNLSWQATLLNNLGVLHFLQGEYDKAILTLEEGLLCAQRSGYYATMETVLFLSMGDIYAEVEDFDMAQSYYKQGQEIANNLSDPFLTNYLNLAKANLSIQKLDLDETNHLLDEASKTISANSSSYEDGLFHILRGQLLLHELKAEEAKKSLKIAETHFDTDGRFVERAKSRILLAAAYCQEENQGAAKRKIKEVLEKYTEYPLLVFARHARDWLADLQSDEEIGQELRELFEKSHQIKKKMPAVRRRIRRLARKMEIPDSKLTIRAFGRAQVKVGGKLLTVSDWQSQSVQDLFFYFLMKAEPLTKEQIGTMFWPEIEDPSRLKMRFKNNIYRLRRAVGRETILFENELYNFNRSLDYEYDVDAFETLLSQAKMTDDPSLNIELLQKAVNLVSGHYLEDIEATWVWTKRERLDQAYLLALMKLAELLKKNDRVQEALDFCQRAIDHESTFEAAYFLAMNIYAKVKDSVNAIRLYEKYREMMKIEFDLPPSTKMEALYKRLVL